MSESTTAGGASEGNQDGNQPTPGSPTPGSPAPTPQAPEADPFAAERSQLEERIRSFQSEKDRIAAERDRLQAEISSRQPDGSPASSTEAGGEGQYVTRTDFEQMGRNLISQLNRAQDLARATEGLRGQFEYADPALFSTSHEFESVFAFEEAVRSSHERNKGLIDGKLEEREAALRAEFDKKHGGGAGGGSPQSAGTAPTGDPTPEALAAMPLSQWAELEKTNPGVIDRVLRSRE